MDRLQPGRAPVYEMLEQYRVKGDISYHVPGHKNGEAYRGQGNAGFLSEVMGHDATEITGTDDLHHPEGVIKEAQELAADCFGAEESFFLVGGSTAGNLALILTVCPEPGMTLILQRNVHKSVIHGLMLAGVRAVFMEPMIDPLSGLAVAPAVETVQAALAAYPEAAAVLVTMPNYYGMGSDLAPLAQACHDSGVPLLVDEAHGAHYGQHPALPAGALMCGADGVVQSTHKMLAALTMGAMLHVQGPWLDRALLRQRLAMVQSSSPSYPVMASLDLARRLVHSQRAGAFTAGLAAVDVLRRGLAAQPRFRLLQPAEPLQPACGGAGAAAAADTPPQGMAAYRTQDPFKAVIYDAAGVLGGFELQRRLEEKGIVPEMSDGRHVVLAFSLGSKAEDTELLLDALQEIAAETPDEPAGLLDDITGQESPQCLNAETMKGQPTVSANNSTWNNLHDNLFSAPVLFSMKPVDAVETESIRLEYSAGRRAAEMVIPYPPGIPLLYTGEWISEDICSRLISLSQGGARFQACADPSLRQILVYNIKKGGDA
ncbi:aminotransferase class I/II-fold pyridoxal phosphate-dependent enzyme [Paenibacillus sp. S150]|uniref:aminotransferase class I/II-fold pyridoxal phosphate-dependent enzyme n=1 Tax=Paenibacillus sp. S150 TaxID=2749826 RepID=UPI001C572A18|nr:aminotransferase class I/II-fold pyridoxal phosphate-dependent enzyme [Paenibacillus sp. S150]MBW4084861.1 aminotransferase class I/II-fold pyridoxal phosphate-dependent enzyme [Paenibacillus sp. S150]